VAGPPGEKFPVIVQVRLSEEQAAEFDAWRERQFRHPTRSEAMRQLVANAVKRKGS
jgi:metal-responsive CopG/Arc/MetJ family transcriptional regulator